MTEQQTAFRFDVPARVTATDVREEKARLSRQCAEILGRLQQGPVTNLELSRIALKYTSRISDLRARGHVVVVQSRDHSTGLVVYALELKP